ncbi:MAG: beta-glucosidase BglX [Ignavibacteriaceae bacterium]
MLKLLTSLRILLIFCLFIPYKSFPQETNIEEKITNLITKMTLQEKVGQLSQFAAAVNPSFEMIKNGDVGSILSLKDVNTINLFQKAAFEQSRLGIPLIFGYDVIHGYKTTFPVPLASASSWDTSLIKESARIAAMEASLDGIKWTFAPMVDVCRDPRWGRIVEGAGEDPFLGSAIGGALVRGFQGDSLNDLLSLAACSKHYVAYGAAEAGREYNTTDISERTLREIYLPPHKAVVDAGAATVMSAFNSLNGIPASANYYTLTEILRNEWGFNGFVVSDWNSVGELVNHGVAADKKEAAFKGFTAGVDMDMIGNTVVGDIYPLNLPLLVEEGKISVNRIDESVRRILRIKFKLGLFDHPYTDTVKIKSIMLTQENRDSVALKLAEESIVLLKNKSCVLPLSRELKSIAVIGPLADDKADPLGPWACVPESGRVISVLNGINKKFSPTIKINYVRGCNIEGNDTSGFEEAVQAALNSEVVIFVAGESSSMSGEAGSRTNLNLPGVQEDLLKRIFSTGKPVVLLLMNGRPLTINWENENINAILECWFLGDQSGNAVANVISGDYNPSGKLTVTFPRFVGQIPIYYNHLNTGRPAIEPGRFMSKYLDSPNSPLFPFGFGLSYTTFKFENLNIQKQKQGKQEINVVSVEITNFGTVPGTEIVQFYLDEISSSVSRPVKELKGFQRIFLNPGETKKVYFSITPDLLESHNLDMIKSIEPGKYDVMIGGSSEDVVSGSFEIVN